jgi:hypothetical protein
MRARHDAGPASERSHAGRGRTISQDGLSPFGLDLHPFIAAKGWRYGDIARKLGLGDNGNQVIGRMMRGEAHAFRFPLDALLRALDVPDASAAALYARASDLGLSFAAAPPAPTAPVASAPPAPAMSATPEPATSVPTLPLNREPSHYVTIGVTHGWGFAESASEVEQDVVRFLWLGDAEHASRRARDKYYQLLHGGRSRQDRLPTDLQKRWLLRFGAIVEQAEEMLGAWHTDRVAASFLALRRIEADIARVDGRSLARSGFGYDQVIILARKAALLRERYVDDRPLSRFYLDMSSTLYEQALGELEIAIASATQLDPFERATLYPAIALALRFQRLHSDAARGDESWVEAVNRLADENTPFKRAHRDLHEAMTLYFKTMGYKRLAWALRPRDGQRDIFGPRRATYYGEADRYIAAFLASPARDAAWHASNLRPFTLPDGRQPASAQPLLISPQQSALLLGVSSMEISVWLRPDQVERQDPRLRAEAVRLYPALLAKLDNNHAFAQVLQGIAPAARR